MHDRRYTEVLGLNAETVWFGSIFAMQMMLSGFAQWELDKICNENDVIAAEFARRVSFWHEKTLIPAIEYIKVHHKPPSFAMEVLKEFTSLPQDSNQIFDLHTKLLCGASETLIECCKIGIGRSATAEVEKWFAVLKEATAELAPFASSDTVEELQQLVESFENEETEKTTSSHGQGQGEEYVFFCHKFLFIHIAYMVEFYTNANAVMKRRFSKNDFAFLAPDTKQRTKWGNVSGKLIQRLFNNGIGGLTVLDTEFTRRGYIEKCTQEGKFQFPLIDYLPYSEFTEQSKKNNGLPSLHELQESVLCKMFGKIRAATKSSNEVGVQNQLTRLGLLFSVTTHFTETSQHTLNNREKVRKCLHKKKQNQSNRSRSRSTRRNRKCPDPDIFFWDVFIMGNNSYFYHFKQLNGTILRDFHKKCKTRNQLYCEDTV